MGYPNWGAWPLREALTRTRMKCKFLNSLGKYGHGLFTFSNSIFKLLYYMLFLGCVLTFPSLTC
jgi:hypothetical protein